jgi:hypothetical protein
VGEDPAHHDIGLGPLGPDCLGEFLDNEGPALPGVEVNPPRDDQTRWQSAGGTIEFYKP